MKTSRYAHHRDPGAVSAGARAEYATRLFRLERRRPLPPLGEAVMIFRPEFREMELLSRGHEPSGLGPEEFAALVRRETVAHGAMVRISGARIE